MQAIASKGRDWIQSGFYFHEKDEGDFDRKYVSRFEVHGLYLSYRGP